MVDIRLVAVLGVIAQVSERSFAGAISTFPSFSVVDDTSQWFRTGDKEIPS
jgi:hypothetical protein